MLTECGIASSAIYKKLKINIQKLTYQKIAFAGDKPPNPQPKKYIQKSIDILQKVPGMTIDKLQLHINHEPTATLKFSDGSGKLFYIVNVANIHHVYVFNEMNLCLFAGYVGWLHIDGLKQAIEDIKKLFVAPNLSSDRIKIRTLNHLRKELLNCKYCGEVQLSKKDFDEATFVSQLDDGYYTYYLNHLVGGQHLYVSAIAKSENFEASYNK